MVALGIDGAAAFADEIIDAAKIAKRVAAKRAAEVIEVITSINKAANVDDAIIIVKAGGMSRWADKDIYEVMASTFKRTDWTEVDIAKLQRSIAKESNWIGKFYDENMNIIWPGTKGDPNINGFVNGQSNLITLSKGSRIDRYGHPGGAFLSPKGTSYGARALKPGTKETSNYYVYEVIKPIEVHAGKIASWFGQIGGGIQYYLGMGKSVQQLIDDGYLKIVKEIIN